MPMSLSRFAAPLALMATAACLSSAASAQQVPPLLPGVYTNEEDVSFQSEAGATIPWIGLRVGDGEHRGKVQPIDRFGVAIGPWTRTMPDGVAIDTHSGNPVLRYGDSGAISMLERARQFRCWISVRKSEAGADGSAQWTFDRNLAMHDQGGRVAAGGGDSGAPGVVIRMRNVVWPAPSTNRPSLVLYVHRPESPDRSESYSWADPEARLVGINLRWMQASCSREEVP